MKIAITIPKYNLGGGAEFYCAELTRILAARGHYDFHVFANKWRSNSERIAFHRNSVLSVPKFLTTPSFAYFFRKEIAKSPFDLVHAHDRVFDADVFTMHGIPHRIWVKEVRKKRFLSLFDRATAWTERQLVLKSGCRKFLAVSGLTRDLFFREYPQIDPGRVEIAHPGIDPASLKLMDRRRSRAWLENVFGFSPQDAIILFVSMNFDIKGLDFVLNGLAGLKSRMPTGNWRLLVVGKGKTERYARRAAAMGIGDRIVFAGVFPRDRLDLAYPGCDLFAMPSKFDTFGMTVLEAMSASLPVVISRTVGAKDLVVQGSNGFIIENTEDNEELAARFELMMDPDTRIVMGRKAFETAQALTWEDTARQTEQIYREVLEQKRRDCHEPSSK